MKPSLGSINLLEWLKNSEKHDTRYQFSIKGCTSAAARWRRRTGPRMWKCGEFPCPSEPTTLPESPLVHNPEVLRMLPFGLVWRLHYTGVTD